jgi:hypothetical protein
MSDNSNNKKNRTQYYREYVEKNKDKLREQHICELCGGKYNTANKANHNKTKKHISGLELYKYKIDNERMKNIFGDINKKIENI